MAGFIYEFEDFRFVPSARELCRAGVRVQLPRRTFECLDFLIAHRDRAIGRDELVQALFGRPNVSDAQLGQVVLRTRRAVGDAGNTQQKIHTIAGFGYRWIAATHAQVEVAAEVVVSRAPAASAAIRHRRLWIAAVAIALLTGSLVFRSMTAERKSPAPARPASAALAVVLPLEVDGLRDDAWMRLGAMDVIAERLREAGLSVPSSESVIGLLSSTGNASPVSDVRLRKATGATLLVRGKAVHANGGWQIELSAAAGHGIAVPAHFAASDALHATRGASDLLLAALGRSAPDTVERDTALDETLQRARAAMLANELDAARSILRTSPQLAAKPAQLAYQLAQVDFRAGLLDDAERALDGVLARPETLADTRFHADVLNARGSVRVSRGAFADGGVDFNAALDVLGPDGDALQRGTARLGRANSLVAAHHFDAALADFGTARIDLESAGDALGVARVDADLGMLELYRGRPAAALDYLPGAADRFEAFGALHELLITLSGLVDAHLAMLQREDAWAAIERASALRERITDPVQNLDLLLNRAQVLMGWGRYRDARIALDQARRVAPATHNGVPRARLGALDAEFFARRGAWREADDAARDALAEWPSAGADGERAGVVLIRQRALLALGREQEAGALYDRARAVPADASDVPGCVADALAMGEWFQHAGAAARARPWFDFAAASADRRGVPAEIVAVAQSRAPALLASRSGETTAAIGRVGPWATHDFEAALLQVRLFHALGQRVPWLNALAQAQKLAGERAIPAALFELGSVGAPPTITLGQVSP